MNTLRDISNPVLKPWGFEFSFFENSSLSIWILHLGITHKSGYVLEDARTSMHLHSSKSATAICAHGSVDIDLFDSSRILTKGDYQSINPFSYHRIQAKCTNSIVIEVETPNIRDDITRLRDDYGRKNLGYDWNISFFLNPINLGLLVKHQNVYYKNNILMRKHSFNINYPYSFGQLFIPTNDFYLPDNPIISIRAGTVLNCLEFRKGLESLNYPTNRYDVDGFLLF